MGSPNLSDLKDPLPVLRDKRVIDISTEDFVYERGFIATPNASGSDNTLVVRTLKGVSDIEEKKQTGGKVVNLDNVPVALRAVRNQADSNTSVSSIIVGIF